MSGRRRRPLRAEEAALWRAVAATLEPLPGKRPPVALEPPAAPPDPPAPPKAMPELPERRNRDGRLPPLAPVEGRIRQRLMRGTIEIDARLDLHGMRQAEAYGRLLRFIRAAQDEGARIVLVITGKGRDAASGEPFADAPGVLRRAVPQWLAAPELRGSVLGFEEAGAPHGGAGALYVRLRRRRRP